MMGGEPSDRDFAVADIIFQFAEDTLGAHLTPPRHVKPYADFHSQLAELQAARIEALRSFVDEARTGTYPETTQVVEASPDALTALHKAIEGARA